VKQDHKQDKELNIQFKLRATQKLPSKRVSEWLGCDLSSALLAPSKAAHGGNQETLSSGNRFLHRILCGHHPLNGRKFLQASLGRTMQGSTETQPASSSNTGLNTDIMFITELYIVFLRGLYCVQ